MNNKNVKTSLFGLTFIGMALICLVSAYLIFDKNHQLSLIEGNLSKGDVNHTNKIDRKILKDVIEEESVSLTSLVKEAEAYHPGIDFEKSDGFMWIDRKSSKYVVTLGAVNGIYPGSVLSVYSGEDKIGEVQVDTSFDVISYVVPQTNSLPLLDQDYYRVEIE